MIEKHINDFMLQYADEKACINYLHDKRWGDGWFCTHCNHNDGYHFSDGKRHKCKKCLKQSTVKVGTILTAGKLPIRIKLLLIYVYSFNKMVTASDFKRILGVHQDVSMRHLNQLKKISPPINANSFDEIVTLYLFPQKVIVLNPTFNYKTR